VPAYSTRPLSQAWGIDLTSAAVALSFVMDYHASTDSLIELGEQSGVDMVAYAPQIDASVNLVENRQLDQVPSV